MLNPCQILELFQKVMNLLQKFINLRDTLDPRNYWIHATFTNPRSLADSFITKLRKQWTSGFDYRIFSLWERWTWRAFQEFNNASTWVISQELRQYNSENKTGTVLICGKGKDELGVTSYELKFKNY